jgi:hypothetical protein
MEKCLCYTYIINSTFSRKTKCCQPRSYKRHFTTHSIARIRTKTAADQATLQYFQLVCRDLQAVKAVYATQLNSQLAAIKYINRKNRQNVPKKVVLSAQAFS